MDIIEKGIESSWTTWGKMRGENLVLGDISYLKSENEKGFERIFSVNIQDDQAFRIQQMIAFIRAGIMPDSLLITPNTVPANLAEILSHKGFSINDADPCMILYLDVYEKSVSRLSDFTISSVTDKAQLSEWLNIVNEALFGCELVTLEQFNDVLLLDNTQFYIGAANGKPVTACMTIVDGDTSVLEMVATLKAYRKKGFASAVIDKALTDLQQKGIKTISLRAEADGVSVYRNLGFKESFKRVVATCDMDTVHRKSCPCRIEKDKIEKAQRIFHETNGVEEFVEKMSEQGIIGRKIWYEPQENAIYIVKMYACDCGGGCPANHTLIGQRCHCVYVNHLSVGVPISYCKCAAHFYEPMFFPLFGEKIQIDAIQTVLSGADECICKIKL
ncbi:MAG: GNAT family N-acetyltransferase [Oscillospiraceae bacterium]|nr:GNAT family N-acetyltransferase [Oscillospiraceae bacterium]